MVFTVAAVGLFSWKAEGAFIILVYLLNFDCLDDSRMHKDVNTDLPVFRFFLVILCLFRLQNRLVKNFAKDDAIYGVWQDKSNEEVLPANIVTIFACIVFLPSLGGI